MEFRRSCIGIHCWGLELRTAASSFKLLVVDLRGLHVAVLGKA